LKNLIGEIIHIIKSITSVIILGERWISVPLRISEVNRMLGKVDELAVNTDTCPPSHRETIKVIDGPFNGFNGTVERLPKKA
jgi:transcriptional antiterminator NusG